MIEKIVLSVLFSIFLLCAGFGLVFIVYLWLIWYVSLAEQRIAAAPPKVAKEHGLSEADLQRLPTVECGKMGAGAECAVCLDLLESSERCRIIPVCGHCFHVECADMWLSKRSVCPLCRRSASNNFDENNGGEERTEQPEQVVVVESGTMMSVL